MLVAPSLCVGAVADRRGVLSGAASTQEEDIVFQKNGSHILIAIVARCRSSSQSPSCSEKIVIRRLFLREVTPVPLSNTMPCIRSAGPELFSLQGQHGAMVFAVTPAVNSSAFVGIAISLSTTLTQTETSEQLSA